MSRDYRPFLDDIRRACEKVIRYAGGLSVEEFLADEKTFDAVLRNLTIIGEAVKQLPEAVRDRWPGIEWRKIARFRDLAIHRYFRVDGQIVWDVVSNHVPRLLEQLGEIPDPLPGQEPEGQS